MAGEIEEPFSFQASTLHSGSVSFGRFEVESLSWERRSSFSHNRYLEEVEKCSTPGSVTQKKAYFEAHFKRKALMRQASDCQNGMECQTSGDSVQDHTSYMEEFEHTNQGIHFAHYNENADGSKDHGECEVMVCEKEGEECPPFEFQMEPTLTSATALLDDGLQHVEPYELHENHFECDPVVLVKDEPYVEIKQKLHDEAGNVDGLPKSSDPSPESLMAGKDHATSLKKSLKPSLKVKATTETKTAKTRLKTQVTVTPVSRNTSSESCKDSAENPRRLERTSVIRTKSGKQPLPKVPPTMCSTKTPKIEDPKKLMEKRSQENQNEKDPREKKSDTIAQPSASDKGEYRSCKTANRPKRAVSSTKSDMKPNGAVFNFKSNERAEKRKEFYMRLEEKMNAKEAELNQIQARTQEETKAEIKQFRRSLDFKAKPMPSFYHEAMPRGSDDQKAMPTPASSTKFQSKSSSPGNRAMARSPSFSKSGYKVEISANESMHTTAQPQTAEAINHTMPLSSETGNNFPSPLNNTIAAQLAGKRIETAGKKVRDNSRASNVQKQQGSESSKVKKEERVGRGVVVGIGKNGGGEMVRKMKKGVGIGDGSGRAHLAVDVVS